jgi:hypothetical protein
MFVCDSAGCVLSHPPSSHTFEMRRCISTGLVSLALGLGALGQPSPLFGQCGGALKLLPGHLGTVVTIVSRRRHRIQRIYNVRGRVLVHENWCEYHAHIIPRATLNRIRPPTRSALPLFRATSAPVWRGKSAGSSLATALATSWRRSWLRARRSTRGCSTTLSPSTISLSSAASAPPSIPHRSPQLSSKSRCQRAAGMAVSRSLVRSFLVTVQARAISLRWFSGNGLAVRFSLWNLPSCSTLMLARRPVA